MNFLKSKCLFLLPMVLLGAAVVFTPTADAQTLYALLITDDGNPSNGHLHNANKGRMERVFRNIKREVPIHLELFELKSNVDNNNPEFMSKDNILRWVRNLNADKDDVVFVYFSGHGRADPNTRELYLTLPTGKFNRKELADAMETISCRLKILVTDPCDFSPVWLPKHQGFKKAYSNLFLEHKGFLNVTAAVEGDYAFGDSEGGIFTHAFIDALLGVYGSPDLNDDGFLSWSEVFEETRKRTHSYFEMLMNSQSMPQRIKGRLNEIGQKSQRPKYFGELPKRIKR